MLSIKQAVTLSVFVSLLVAVSTGFSATVYDAQGGQFTVNGADTSGGTEARNHPGIIWRETGRLDMGWSGNGGGNLEAYSKGHATRPGQFKFIYGGTPSIGKIVFSHFNGSVWTDRMVLTNDGRLGIDIGSSEPCVDCKLDVNGKIRAEEIVVETGVWPDYVFKENYRLMPLSEIDQFIKVNGHLPGVPKADQAKANGVNLGDVSKILLGKIEELTLHMIELEKKNGDLENQLARLGRSKDVSD